MRDLTTCARLWVVGVVLVALLVAPRTASGEDYFTLIVVGASGDPSYAETYDAWRQRLVAALRSQEGFRDDHLRVLSETPGPGVGRASQQGVTQAIQSLRAPMTADSVLMVVLLGHGTFDGVDAKFNLVGPDLEAGEWNALLETLPGRAVVVNTTAASAPFVRRLAKKGRVVISATESAVQRYDTVFPEFFVSALAEPAADADKSGRVSVWEAFEFTSQEVRRWYQQQGRLATERAILDDTGDGVGREVDQRGEDGTLAVRLYVGAGVTASTGVDPSLAPLVAQRDDLERAVAELKSRKASMDAEVYATELESLLVDLARLSREIRAAVSTTS